MNVWRMVVVALALSVAHLSGACSSDNDGATLPAGADASAASATVADGAAGDPDNCVKPGTKNNEQGLGGYCEAHADCVRGQSFCTAVLGAPLHAWFCSRPCSDDPNCGDGLYCAHDPRGVACVPIVCGVTDAGADAPDTSTDANSADADDAG